MIAFTDEDCPRFYSERRYAQLRRLFATMQVLQGFRFGADLEAINYDVGDRSGEPVCQRTTRRDMEFLADAGLVEYLPKQKLYRWSGVLKMPAVTIPVAADTGRQSGTRVAYRDAA